MQDKLEDRASRVLTPFAQDNPVARLFIRKWAFAFKLKDVAQECNMSEEEALNALRALVTKEALRRRRQGRNSFWEVNL